MVPFSKTKYPCMKFAFSDLVFLYWYEKCLLCETGALLDSSICMLREDRFCIPGASISDDWIINHLLSTRAVNQTSENAAHYWRFFCGLHYLHNVFLLYVWNAACQAVIWLISLGTNNPRAPGPWFCACWTCLLWQACENWKMSQLASPGNCVEAKSEFRFSRFNCAKLFTWNHF